MERQSNEVRNEGAQFRTQPFERDELEPTLLRGGETVRFHGRTGIVRTGPLSGAGLRSFAEPQGFTGVQGLYAPGRKAEQG